MKTKSAIELKRKTDFFFDNNQSISNENSIENKKLIHRENTNEKIFKLNVRLLSSLLFIILFFSY